MSSVVIDNGPVRNVNVKHIWIWGERSVFPPKMLSAATMSSASSTSTTPGVGRFYSGSARWSFVSSTSHTCICPVLFTTASLSLSFSFCCHFDVPVAPIYTWESACTSPSIILTKACGVSLEMEKKNCYLASTDLRHSTWIYWYTCVSWILSLECC